MDTGEIRLRLGAVEPNNAGALSSVIGLCMELCNRVSDLEGRVARHDESIRQAANTASCLANGIVPD